ncbi:autotransporter assembly complex protein TamA [Thioclava nitratireducens]|uniref:autotransporter assembly complex protein TamA n=1 Tax=Thioclava nitratireducens TaxID=1915078 RepID=UPI0024806EE9|nr:autotransporter assembly complex family protein [Thioclava nitratireducens]WGT51922.1 autotransporter assembly complex family protein [Thioclava nitratireducens]
MGPKTIRVFHLSVAALAILATPALAYSLKFNTPGASDDLRNTIKGASLLAQSADDKSKDAQDVLAEARADYNRIVSALFGEGRYSGTVSIKLDGREAASIPPLDAPSTVNNVTVTVTPGPEFTFSRADIAPVAPKTDLPEGYKVGKVAKSGVIVDAASAATTGWRDAGHAKAEVSYQNIVADHRANQLASDVRLAPGPLVTFGRLETSGNKRLRTKRLREIAGFPKGEVYDPKKLDQVQSRLQRTGIFSSVTITEAKTLNPDDSLDVNLAVVEQKKRKIGLGAELSSSDGLGLNGYWLHRNLFGGGERFRVDAGISGIGGATGGTDYSIGARIDRPATFNPETSAYITTEISQKNEEDYTENAFDIGFGLTRIFNDKLTGDVSINYGWSKVTDDSGETYFRQVYLPTKLTWDDRDNALDPTKGYYIQAGVTPFVGIGGDTGTGAQVTGDLRAYKGFGQNDRFVLAGRVQLGGVYGSNLENTPRDYLFYSGGGGTVRGQPYQSLGVEVLEGGTLKTGGTEFVGFQGEARIGITDKIGAVAFYDYGYVAGGGQSGSQAGAGLGLRYKTGIGPIRLDVGFPVSGGTGSGAQLYIGIGQAF